MTQKIRTVTLPVEMVENVYDDLENWCRQNQVQPDTLLALLASRISEDDELRQYTARLLEL